MTANYQLPTANCQLKVIAAIPCFNTERSITDIVKRARRYVDQVIVINDGSCDNTADAARVAGALVISHEKNLGKGAAMKSAAEAASNADVIVFLDGDGQHDPEDISKIIAPILQNKADLVIGSRCLPESKTSVSPFTRRFSNNVASFIISMTISFLLPLAIQLNRLTHPTANSQLRTRNSELGTPNSELSTANSELPTGKLKRITDCTSGFRAIKQEAWQKLKLSSQGFGIETEMIYEAARNGLIITGAPISCNWNSQLSRLSILQDGSRTLKLLARKLTDDIRK